MKTLVRVMPVFRGQSMPVAVFVSQRGFWQQSSKEYWNPAWAVKAAKRLAGTHVDWEYSPKEEN